MPLHTNSSSLSPYSTHPPSSAPYLGMREYDSIVVHRQQQRRPRHVLRLISVGGRHPREQHKERAICALQGCGCGGAAATLTQRAAGQEHSLEAMKTLEGG
jgi:hypothetical protein